MTQSTLATRVKSIKLLIDRTARQELCSLAMRDPAEIEKRLAHIEAVIGIYRDERSKLDDALNSLEEMASKLRKGKGDEPMSSATALLTGTTPDEASGTASTEPDDASLAVGSSYAAEIPGYRICEQCETFFKPGFSHECDDHGGHDDWNTFEEIQLDMIHGEGGWHRIEPPFRPEPKPRFPWKVAQSPPEIPDQPPPENPEQPLLETPEKPEPADRSVLRAHGLREGSKKRRIYELTVKLLQNGPMYIDEILKNIPEREFEEVTSDRRTNLSNVLSQLKTKGLLISDNRGNWSLPPRSSGAE